MGIRSSAKVSEQSLIARGVHDCQGKLHASGERGLATRLRGSRGVGEELGLSSCTSAWGSCSQTSDAAGMDMTFCFKGQL